MSKKRLPAAAVLFIAATCIKFTLPSVSAMLHEKLETAMERETDLRAAAVSLGEKLAPGDKLIAVLGLNKAEDAEPSPAPVPETTPTGKVRLPET
ncbi:hypothetical protein, partial [Fibrobacter sp.]|uniref:hypothetical protein n=1 Tax=Fibrobacter sp. TaxID=35828 RepID=UPI00388FB40C